MAQSKRKTVPLFLALSVSGGLLAVGVWFLGGRMIPSMAWFSSAQNGDKTLLDTPAQAKSGDLPPLDTSLPNPSELTIDGSVAMIALMQQLQLAYTQSNPGIPATYGIPDGKPSGTNAAINNLVTRKAWIVASSRPLRPEERKFGLQSIPIARDAIAVVVGADNPFKGSLTLEQLKQIFQGQITNWSEVGGPDAPIRLIHPSHSSGSRDVFQRTVMSGQSFAPDGENVITLVEDETTEMLNRLGNSGISYITVQQVKDQKAVRIVPIADVSPLDREAVKTGEYPIVREVYLVVKPRTSPVVKQFVEMALSSQGQQIAEQTGFLPL